MIVARVEIWPHGDPRALRQIAAIGIVNVGPEGGGYHAYEARCEGRVVRLRHREADGPLTLLRLAIGALEADDGRNDIAVGAADALGHRHGCPSETYESHPLQTLL